MQKFYTCHLDRWGNSGVCELICWRVLPQCQESQSQKSTKTQMNHNHHELLPTILLLFSPVSRINWKNKITRNYRLPSAALSVFRSVERNVPSHPVFKGPRAELPSPREVQRYLSRNTSSTISQIQLWILNQVAGLELLQYPLSHASQQPRGCGWCDCAPDGDHCAMWSGMHFWWSERWWCCGTWRWRWRCDRGLREKRWRWCLSRVVTFWGMIWRSLKRGNRGLIISMHENNFWDPQQIPEAMPSDLRKEPLGAIEGGWARLEEKSTMLQTARIAFWIIEGNSISCLRLEI